MGNVYFTLFVSGVLIFTIIAANYQPREPLFRSSSKITTFLTSPSATTFGSDDSIARTGEDFIAPSNQVALAGEPFLNATDVPSDNAAKEPIDSDPNAPIDYKDSEVFRTMMRATIKCFKDVHFYRFGKPLHHRFWTPPLPSRWRHGEEHRGRCREEERGQHGGGAE